MSCILCNDSHSIKLQCTHDICLQCTMSLFDGFEETKCPVCRAIIDMEEIIKYTPCAKCKGCSSNHCDKCEAFLCDDCWGLIHSFKPANTHVKSSYRGNPVRSKELLQMWYASLQDMKKIDSDLSNLNDENLKIKSIKSTTLEQGRQIFNNYRQQLADQEIAFEKYIEEQSRAKKASILKQKNTMASRIESCKSQLYDHHDEIVLPDANYTSTLEYDIIFKDHQLPNIVVFPEQMTEDYFKEDNGRQNFYKKGTKILHRDNDLPAVINADGSEWWYQDGKLHRENDRPAEILSSGEQRWWYRGLLHREHDYPAIIHLNGRLEWYKNGKLHRNYDKPAQIISGSQYWYQNGKLHRNGDKPAVIYANGRQAWYQNGLLHRDNGPAMLFNDGSCQWYQYGAQIMNK